ncbi:SUKH-3 domain-containing protein [Streptomyces sp. NPDC042319]|uniref:SUKH-3 domain-containing protein n=1 Tax=Streptomyces sp. NPDC042319 TaxID=3154332 RepID=UPI0033C31F6E
MTGVSDWLAANGWTPGRDIGARADELIRIRVDDAERQGTPLTPPPSAVRVIRTYGSLHLDHPTVRNSAWDMEPTAGYDGDAEDIREMATGLGATLFPVGYETSEYALLLVDEKGRFFSLHHTGGHYLGENEFDAFDRFLRGGHASDVADLPEWREPPCGSCPGSMPGLRFFFDAGSGGVLWTMTPEDREQWGYPVDPGRLPVSRALRNELEGLVARYDTSMNWASPADPGPWREAECLEFNEAAGRTLGRLRAELGPAWRVYDEFFELHEDPDLDRCLADPHRFIRARGR